jgi:hypothetical protein
MTAGSLALSQQRAREYRAVVDYEFVNGIMVIYILKGVLAFTPDEVKIGLKRGKRFKRRESFEARMTPVPYAEFRQASQEVKHASPAVVRRETKAEQEATTRAKESSMAVFLTIELPASEIGPPDLVQGLRRLNETLIEEATTYELIADPDETVQAFLMQHPSWRLRPGFTRFSAGDSTPPNLYGLSRPASAAFTAWIRAGGLTHASNGLECRDLLG